MESATVTDDWEIVKTTEQWVLHESTRKYQEGAEYRLQASGGHSGTERKNTEGTRDNRNAETRNSQEH